MIDLKDIIPKWHHVRSVNYSNLPRKYVGVSGSDIRYPILSHDISYYSTTIYQNGFWNPFTELSKYFWLLTTSLHQLEDCFPVIIPLLPSCFIVTNSSQLVHGFFHPPYVGESMSKPWFSWGKHGKLRDVIENWFIYDQLFCFKHKAAKKREWICLRCWFKAIVFFWTMTFPGLRTLCCRGWFVFWPEVFRLAPAHSRNIIATTGRNMSLLLMDNLKQKWMIWRYLPEHLHITTYH